MIPGTHEYDTIASDGTNLIFVPCIRLNASISTAPTITAAMNGTSTTARYAIIGATLVCVSIMFSRWSAVMLSICFCVRELCWSCRIMKLRQPTR